MGPAAGTGASTAAALTASAQRHLLVMTRVLQVGVLLELTDDLLTVVGRGRTAVEQAVNRQTALYSLKLLCRNLGPDHRDSFVPVLLRVTDLIASEEEDKSVTSSALLCAAELVGALKALAIPQLPRWAWFLCWAASHLWAGSHALGVVQVDAGSPTRAC